MAELEVTIDGRGAARGAKVVTRSLDGIQKKAGQTNAQLKKTSAELKKTGRSGLTAGRALGGLAAVLVARKIVQYADAWTGLQNRLKLVTTSQENLALVSEEVFQIAQRTRGGLAETADLYSRIARSSDTLNVSQAELLSVTESINQAIAISGSTTESANAAIIQLGQGLAAGALRGQELMSVMEQTPRLSRALADGLGVPIGELRAMGEAGEITAAKVIKAIKDQKDVLETEFGGTSATVAQSFVQLENAVIRAVGKFSDATGAAGGFAGIIKDLADFISDDFTPAFLDFGDELAVAFQEAGRVGDELSANWSTLGDTFVDAFEGAGVDIVSIMQAIGLDAVTESGFMTDALTSIPLNFVRAFEIAATEIGGIFLNIANEAELAANAAKGIFASIIGDEEGENQAIQERLMLLGEERDIEKELDAQRIKIGDRIIEQETAITAAREKRAAASEKADRDELKRKNEIAAGTRASPQQLKDASKLLKSLETDQEEFQRNIAKINELQKAGALTQDQYNLAIQRTSEAYSAGLPEVEAYNDAVEEAAKLTEDLQTPQEKHASNVERIDGLMQQNLISWETFGRAVKESAEEMRSADPAYLTQEERLSRIQELLGDVATPQEEFNMAMAELNELQSDMDPGDYERLSAAAQKAFEEATLAADPFLQKLVSLGETAAQSIESAFSDFLLDPTKQGFEDMATSFATALQRMAADALTAQIFQSLFGGAAGAAGGGGGLGGLLGGALTGVFAAADGGTFPGGQPVLVGEEGPEIITPRSQSTIIPNDQSAGMMAQAPPVVNVNPQIINVQDPQAAVAAMESSSGQQAIVNAISQNPDAIKRALS
jgi:tape measure domain-containing protein